MLTNYIPFIVKCYQFLTQIYVFGTQNEIKTGTLSTFNSYMSKTNKRLGKLKSLRQPASADF